MSVAETPELKMKRMFPRTGARRGPTRGYWVCETPAGEVVLYHANLSKSPHWGVGTYSNETQIWLERAGLIEAQAATRRELLVIIRDAVRRFPLAGRERARLL